MYLHVYCKSDTESAADARQSPIGTAKRPLLSLDIQRSHTVWSNDLWLLILPIAVATPYFFALEFQGTTLRRCCALCSFNSLLTVNSVSLTFRYLNLLVEGQPARYVGYAIDERLVITASRTAPECSASVVLAQVDRIG